MWTSGGVKQHPTLKLWSHKGDARCSAPLDGEGTAALSIASSYIHRRYGFGCFCWWSVSTLQCMQFIWWISQMQQRSASVLRLLQGKVVACAIQSGICCFMVKVLQACSAVVQVWRMQSW